MTLTTESLRGWLAQPNVVAFLAAIELGEIPAKYRGTPDAYRVLYGGTLIDDLGRHPNVKVTAGGYTSTAAGRFQALFGTWSDFCRFLGELPETVPFTPEFQDLFGVWCLQRRHALQDIVAGKIDAAIAKCNKEWSSMPGAPYGQPTVTLDQFLAAYAGAGGTIDNGELLSPMPAPAAPVEPAEQPETTMPLPILALISAFGPILADLIPTVAKAFDKKSETPAKIEAATKIINTVVSATNSTNIQEAVEKMQAQPDVREAAAKAVVTEPQIMGLLEIGGGIEATRAANLVVQNADKPFWYNPAFWFVMTAIVPPLYGVVGVLLWRMPEPSEQLVTQVVTGILGLAAAAGAYHLGSTQGSAKKTEIIAQQGSTK